MFIYFFCCLIIVFESVMSSFVFKVQIYLVLQILNGLVLGGKYILNIVVKGGG